MSDVGTSTSVAFGTSGFTAEVLSVNGNDISRPPIDVTHLGSTPNREFIPGKLVDQGSIEMEILFDPDDQPPVDAAAEVVTITFPLPSGQGTAATLVFNGFIEAWSWGAPLEDRMTATMTVKNDGSSSVWTASAA